MSIAAFALLLASSTTGVPTLAVLERIDVDAPIDLRATFDFVPSLATTFADDDLRAPLLKCAGDAACIARVVPDDYERALIAIVVARDQRITVAIDVVDTVRGERVVRHFGEIDANAREPSAAVAAELRTALARAGHTTLGSLRVDAEPPDAEIAIDGTPWGPRGLLTPGTHALRVSAPDHEPRDESVPIVAGQETTRTVSLEASGVSSTTWLWIGAAAVAVVAASVAIVATRGPSESTPVRLCQRAAEDLPCGAAR